MIKILDKFISDKIAAGEVIENPLSVVKELVENSIDAKADIIRIELKNGGKSYIRVTDNGIGIDNSEVEIAFEKHATGKIDSIIDLNNIKTLGFRGEALTSICAVSHLTMITKKNDVEYGTKLSINGGKIIKKEDIGTNTGTTVIVEDLFYNLPARRKFMKSDANEASKIIELISHLSIFYSNISFRLTSNNEQLIFTSGSGNTQEAIGQIYKSTAFKNLLEIKGEGISGYIGDAGNTKSNKKGQIFFVNGRTVKSNIIEKALIDGYDGRIFSGNPIGIIFIQIDPEKIDVNIHPAKKEIKFLFPDEIKNNIKLAVRNAIFMEGGIPTTTLKTTNIDIPYNEQITLNDNYEINDKNNNKISDNKDIFSYLKEKENSSDDLNDYIPQDENIKESTEFKRIFKNDIIIVENKPFDIKELKFAGYILNTYIIMETKDAIYLLDQHAAHERIMYEKLIFDYDNDAKNTQELIMPYDIDVLIDTDINVEDWIYKLRHLGYIIEKFGEHSYIIRGIPTYMTIGESKIFAETFADNLGEISTNEDYIINKLIMRSCKSAVKGNQPLSQIEIDDLLANLDKCSNPFSCPHGRPTFIKMTRYEIERAFKRK